MDASDVTCHFHHNYHNDPLWSRNTRVSTDPSPRERKQSNEVPASRVISSGGISASQVLHQIILAGSQIFWIALLDSSQTVTSPINLALQRYTNGEAVIRGVPPL